MKAGISRSTQGPAQAAELVRAARRTGFAGIQFKTRQLEAWGFDVQKLSAFDARAADLGRAGVVFHPGTDFDAWPDITDRVLRFARDIGGEHVCYCCGPRREAGFTVGAVAQALTRTGRQYAEHGIGFSFHNHTHSLFDSLDAIAAMCQAVDSGVCGLTFDTAHAAACGIDDLPRAIDRLADHVWNVHVKDLSEAGQFCPVGRGTLDLTGALEALQRIGFDEWLIVDEESADFDTPESLRISADFLAVHGLMQPTTTP